MKKLLMILPLFFLTSCGFPTPGQDFDDKLSYGSADMGMYEGKEGRIAESKSPASLSAPGPLKEEIEGIIPATIEIPSIGVKASVEQVGQLPNGQMGVPQKLENTGWFEKGPKPGERGNAVIAGHVDSKTGPAVFYRLGRVNKGDKIIIKDDTGNSITFIVKDKKAYPRKAAPLTKIFGYSYVRHLNLITCTGDFNSQAGTHEKRLVVYAEQQ